MRSATGYAIRAFCYGLALATLAVAITGLPAKTSAAELSTINVQQVLPPGGTNCSGVSVSDFTPYIYADGLDSFEFTVSDSSYVAVAGSVGDTSIPLFYMTRRVDASGAVRIHVDIEGTPVVGSLPIRVTLMSAHGVGQPVCLAVVSANLGSGASQPVTTTVPQTPTGVSTLPVVTPAIPAAPETSTSATTAVPVVPPQAAGSVTQNSFAGACGSVYGAMRLWFILLVLYAIVASIIVWPTVSNTMPWGSTPARRVTAILILLVFLLGFWYFATVCRVAAWAPLVAMLIAAAGVWAALRNKPNTFKQLLLIEQPPKK